MATFVEPVTFQRRDSGLAAFDGRRFDGKFGDNRPPKGGGAVFGAVAAGAGGGGGGIGVFLLHADAIRTAAIASVRTALIQAERAEGVDWS